MINYRRGLGFPQESSRRRAARGHGHLPILFSSQAPLVNRLLPSPRSWGQSFSYDGFGNRTALTVTKGSAPNSLVNIDPAGAQAREQRNLNEIARKYKIDRHAFGDFVEEEKALSKLPLVYLKSAKNKALAHPQEGYTPFDLGRRIRSHLATAAVF